MAPSLDWYWTIPATVFVAGMIGSPHCVSMCGPLVLSFSQSRKRLIAYQGGRLMSYTLVGALVGAFGHEVLGSDRPLWLTILSLSLIAILLIINGYRAIAGRPIHFPFPKVLINFSTQLWRKLRLASLPPSLSALASGCLTVLLPCGHLYSFLLGAVATGSALRGGAFMAAFWLGATPLPTFAAGSIGKLMNATDLGRRRLSGVLLILAGLIGLYGFAARSVVAHDATHASHHAAPTGAITPVGEQASCH